MSGSYPVNHDEHAYLASQLHDLYSDIVDKASNTCFHKPQATAEIQASCDNLLAYLALRRHDIFDLQSALAEHGLSSLGRLEPSVLASIERVMQHLGAPIPATTLYKTTNAEARTMLEKRSIQLLGRPREQRSPRIMVTLDTAAIASPGFIEELLRSGMDMARINCAHDNPETWYKIIDAIRTTEAQLERSGQGVGRRCHIVMDLGGPKIRTGALLAESRPLKLSVPPITAEMPHPQLFGYLDSNAAETEKINLPDSTAKFIIALPGQKRLEQLPLGSTLFFEDSRNRKRTFHVLEHTGPGRVKVSLSRNAHIEEGIMLCAENGLRFRIGPVAAQPVRIEVQAGDRLLLYRDPQRLGHPAREGRPAGIACTLPAALTHVEIGDRLFIDDGKISAHVTGKNDTYLELRILSPDSAPARIKAEKGINIPDSLLDLPALTEQDKEALPFIAEHADAVGLSFVQRPQDLLDLHHALIDLGRPEFGIIAKIENPEALHGLAQLLITGLQFPCFGVMIARGDLAVEVGFENLAIIQEQILCLCEAAHVPVIWATQVLETMAKTGLPARAEITDAASAHRADAVMLNKGAHIIDAIKTLSALLCSEERNHMKKRQIFRQFTEQHGIFE
ncbi:pyruvate kinase [Heliophilum fasciatum]|uniref:Pyruvate kinase n=1 Tax=Heliophilum fasciatum TaxID=35700 RepID=A0A4R2S877_9FIRM|nr:pyruvate kinase [Heliophilum fasciatum]MCW2276929.1 pyruvate kinase [Heliophilum fasciatum]TCP68611.1 pyruvate kinase [Heliophilum fasciatum]